MATPKENKVTIQLRDNLVYLRTKKGLSMSQLAEELGLKKSDINNWEMSPIRCSPALFELVRLADYYKVTIDKLLRHNLSKHKN